MIEKIPCLVCGEPNFPNDILCWKCGEPLQQRQQIPLPQPEPEPKPAPVQEVQACQCVPESKLKPNAIMEAVIAMETEGPSQRKNLMLAVILAAVIGAAVNLLFSVPFYSWLQADSLPASAGTTFILLSTFGAAGAGAVSSYHRLGSMAGMVVYAVSLVLVRILGISPNVIAPPQLWTYHLFSGYFIGYVGMAGAVMVLMAMKRRVLPPSFSPKSPLNAKPGMLVALPIVVGIMLAVSMAGYRAVREQAVNDPVRVVAGFCWAATSGWNGNTEEIKYLLGNRLNARGGTALKPQYPLPSPRAIKSMCLGNADKSVMTNTVGNTSEVSIQTSSDTSWTPSLYTPPGGETDSLYTIKFTLARESDAWKIVRIPQVMMPGQ